MTRAEIEKILLEGRELQCGPTARNPIKLDTPQARQLLRVILGNLQSSAVDDLVKDDKFFRALETAFLADAHEMRPRSKESYETNTTIAEKDLRSWRLQKVESRGFGGLNAQPDDIFEFDVSGQHCCIEGQNGSGKSSLANAVLFALSGKVHRDQHGIWEDSTRLEPVMSDDGHKLGMWPPFAIYPSSWENEPPLVDVSVTLTFETSSDDELVKAKRRIYGSPGSFKEEVSIDSRLTAVPTLIEAGVLMPMRIQHIRMPEHKDNDQLVGLIRQLIGLEPVLDVAKLVDKLCHGNQRFRRYARNNDHDGKRKNISRLSRAAQQKIDGLDTGLDLIVEIEPMMQVPDARMKNLLDAEQSLTRMLSEGFQALAGLAFREFNPAQAEHRQRVAKAVNRLYHDADRQRNPNNLPEFLKGIKNLVESVGGRNFEALKSALREAHNELAKAANWSEQQTKDTLLRLKAIAAEHFEDCDDPLCPLCRQSIKGAEHRNLVEDLQTLKSEAEAAQTRLADACRRIEQKVRQATRNVIPEIFMEVKPFTVKRHIRNELLSRFAEADNVFQDLPGFSEFAQGAFERAFIDLKEVKFGSQLPEPADGRDKARVSRLLFHLTDIIQVAENSQPILQACLDCWTRLFSNSEEQSVTSYIREYKKVIDGLDPIQSASERVTQVYNSAKVYNAIVKRQATREKIANAVEPLRKLRELVSLTTRKTIDDVSDKVHEIHQDIYNPEFLTYQKADVSETRSRLSLFFMAKLGSDYDWQVDASLLANVSWMRGILWSFIFAIRERAIEQAGHCPFEPIMLDDPQITFDTRNLKGWAKFLGSPDGLRNMQACQLLVTTHSRQLALELKAGGNTRMVGIEAGQPFSRPAQIVEGDFACVRFDKMVAQNSDDQALSLIRDIRVLAETLLKLAIQSFEPAIVEQKKATLGVLLNQIKQSNDNRKPPYNDPVFGDLVALKASNSAMFKTMNEAHHSVSETITVNEGKNIYHFWIKDLFPAIQQIWERYRFLQGAVIGEAAAVPLPANCIHKPTRSNVLAALRPRIFGRVSAYSDGRAATAVRIDNLSNGYDVDLSSRAAYRLEKDTLFPVARVGDILLTSLDKQCRASNLVVEDRGTHLIARRWHENKEDPALAVLAALPSNPREVPAAVISRAIGANRRKIVGVLFAADRLQTGDRIGSEHEATCLEADNRVVAGLVADTDAFEVQGNSAEPIALDKQYLLAKSARDDPAHTIRDLDGKPVIAEDSEECAYFKRLRVLDTKSVILESLDKTGSEEQVRLWTDSRQSGPMLVRVREVVGVVFDLK